jgi:mitotic spindle assembly checkpoint protein MAD2
MSTTTTSSITLRGSTAIVVEFFGFAVNSILYQRGIFPPETFKRVAKYGLTLLVSTDQGLNAYLEQVMGQMSEWLLQSQVEKLVLVMTGTETGQTLERWVFNVETTIPTSTSNNDENSNTMNIDKIHSTKSEKEIMNEIQAVIRQITASVTFLPLLQESCSFDLLVYAKNDTKVPTEWEDSDPKYITSNSAEVRLRSFTTKIHTVDAMVSYRAPDY